MKTAVVTGGGSGIGLAIAQRLSADGYHVATLDLDPPGTGFGQKADVTDRAQVDAALSAARERLGPVTILVNAAGLDDFKRFTDLTFAAWQRVIDVNLNGVFHCSQAVLPGMLDAGWRRIVNISSSSAQSGQPFMTHYVAAKSAVNGLTKALALEFGSSGITVNAVSPGFIDAHSALKSATSSPASGRDARDTGSGGSAGGSAGHATGPAPTPSNSARSASSAPVCSRSQRLTADHVSPPAFAQASAPSRAASSGRAQETAAHPSAVGSSLQAPPAETMPRRRWPVNAARSDSSRAPSTRTPVTAANWAASSSATVAARPGGTSGGPSAHPVRVTTPLRPVGDGVRAGRFRPPAVRPLPHGPSIDHLRSAVGRTSP